MIEDRFPLVVVALVAEPAVLGRPEDVLWIVGERHGVEPERDPGIAREHRQSAAEVPWLCRRNDHDLSGLEGHRLRTLGGVSEAKVPFILSEPLNDEYRLKAGAATLKSYQIFEYAINGTQA